MYPILNGKTSQSIARIKHSMVENAFRQPAVTALKTVHVPGCSATTIGTRHSSDTAMAGVVQRRSRCALFRILPAEAACRSLHILLFGSRSNNWTLRDEPSGRILVRALIKGHHNLLEAIPPRTLRQPKNRGPKSLNQRSLSKVQHELNIVPDGKSVRMHVKLIDR